MDKFYRGRKVLITGHTGFKGTWLAYLLHELGAEVYGYALPPTQDSLYWRAAPPLAGEQLSDVRDAIALCAALKRFQPDVVFHLAAHSSMDGVFEIPAEIFEINTIGTVRLLEAVRACEKRIAVLVVTSDKCYQIQPEGEPYREDCPLGAADAYSTSKACQELVAQCYSTSFLGGCVATARASNTVGGGDGNTSRLIPYLLGCFLAGEEAKLRNPDHIRPWQYVLDVLGGYLALGKALYMDQAAGSTMFNFGPGADGFQPVERVAQELAGHFPGARYCFAMNTSSREVEILRLDSSKARLELGWQPLYTFPEMLERTARFALECRTSPADEVCQVFVRQYLNLLRGGRG